MSGSIPASIALVAPVGLNDLAENPCPDNPALEIELSRILATEEAEIALYGLLRLRNTAPSDLTGSVL